MNGRAEDAWWIPVAGVHGLPRDVPQPVVRVGDALVLWHDGSAWRAFDDRCPHRGAQLSIGRVHAGRLECAYHGWCFDGTAQCVAIPALPAFTPPPTHRARAWQVREVHGLLWVAAVGAPTGDPHLPPALDELPPRRVLCGPYDVATSAPRVVENFLDTAHFGLVHEGWLGDRSHLQVPDHEVRADLHGRPGVPSYRAWQPQASSAAEAGAWVGYRYQLLSPYAALLEKQAEPDQGASAPREAYALWIDPLEAERSRVWFTLFTSDTQRSDAELRAFQERIFAQDRPILESQRPRALPLNGGELHCAADRLSAAYRRWLREQRIGFGVC